MNNQERVFEVRRRIATVEGMRQGANAELMELKKIPCPNCENGDIEKESEAGTKSSSVYLVQCSLCGGTGKACGNRGY